MFGSIRACDFVRAGGLAFSVAAAAAGANQCGFGHVEAPAGLNLDARGGELVPAAKLGERDAKTVGDGDQGVAAAGGVVEGVCRGAGSLRYGHNQGLDAIELCDRVELVGIGQCGDGDAVCVGDGCESVIGRDLVIAPGVSLALRDGCDLLLEEGCCSRWQMQVKLGVGGSDHPQEAWIQRDQFIDRDSDDV